MPHLKIIEDICEDCSKYCILKEILLHSGMDDRVLEQLKCVERFKFNRSNIEGKEIGWRDAHQIWIGEGYAEKFAKIYKPEMMHDEIYRLVMEI